MKTNQLSFAEVSVLVFAVRYALGRQTAAPSVLVAYGENGIARLRNGVVLLPAGHAIFNP